MQPVEEYRAEVLATVRPLDPRQLALAAADGAVLAQNITARAPLPPFDNSAMDGYAVRSADLAAASADSPVTLPVEGEVPAGETRPTEVKTGSCVRIMTGALMPGGADAVVPVEQTDGGARQVQIRHAARPGDSVRRAGGDAQAGDLLLAAGTQIGAPQLGLLAAAGHGSVLDRKSVV